MAKKRGYQPSPAEIQKAEGLMTSEQKKMSALREQKLAELKDGESAIKAEGSKKELTVEQKRAQSIQLLEGLVGRAKARLKVYEGDQKEELEKNYGFHDLPDSVQEKLTKQLEQVLEKRRGKGLPELYFNSQSSDLTRAKRGLLYDKHARGLGGETQSGYGLSVNGFLHGGDGALGMWAVTTSNSPRSESNYSAYKPEGVVLVFTHPREAIREMERYIEDLKNGRQDGYPAAVVTSIEDFFEGVDKVGMPGDPKKK